MRSNYFFTFLALLFSNATFAQTTVPALITTNQTWDASGSPYLITQNTYIDTGVSVIVKPGVEITFSTNVNLTVAGEFQAVGTKDSVIKIDLAQFNFSSTSVPYDDSTKRGLYFKYCDITGQGTAKRAISVSTTGARIDHCNFTDAYYCFYMLASSNPGFAIITNSDFSGDGSNYGYPIYTSGNKLDLVLTDNNFHDAYYLYLYGKIVFERNKTNNLKAVNFNLYNDAVINCNQFVNMTNGVQMTVYSYGVGIDIDFNHNTLDSLGSGSYYPMFKLSKLSSSYLLNKLSVNYNNFLHNSSTIEKVQIAGSNSAPTSSDTLNFNNNFWNSTQPSVIATYIKDYTDDIMIFGKADFSNFLYTPDTLCNLNGPCGTADFAYTSQGQTISFSNTSNAPNGSIYEWDFGDGNTDALNPSTVTHQYANAGTYMACLTLYDANGNYCDMHCDTISVSSSSSCQASFYYATDTSNVYNLYVINNSTGTSSNTQYSWSFGDGSSSNLQHPTHEYDSFGLYSLCLTLQDSASGCYSTYCDSVGLDSNGIMLKREGFSITVLDEKDILSAPNFLPNASLTIYPNPTTGIVNVKIKTDESGLLTTKLLTSLGQEISNSNSIINSNNQVIVLDFAEFQNGMYFLQFELNGRIKMERILIAK